ncbi:MAG: hypothetical protein JNL72_05280 [Flavipsychrobacter sp.]|nr:hypothetical protein [Flavipsychrobacter sp.]
MSLKILLIGDEERAMQVDKTYLVDRGLHVHTCLYTDIINDLVAETKPDVIFINPTRPGSITMDVYQHFINDINLLSMPIIYTMAEDDVYLVNRRRTVAKPKRNLITDNMIDAIKLALTRPQAAPLTLPVTRKQHMPLSRHAYRA